MSDDIDVEGIFKDILAILHKHSIPVNTVALDISSLNTEFENFFSQNEQLSRYKAGVFYKSLHLENNIPVTIKIQRRLPFDEIALRLERDVLPLVQKWGEEIEHDFENMQVKVNAIRSDNHPRLPQKYSYNISIECRKKGGIKPNYGDLMLSINLSQYDATSYPKISAYVGMLVDEESGDDWGIHIISTLFTENQEVHEGILKLLGDSLPSLYKSLRTALTNQGTN